MTQPCANTGRSASSSKWEGKPTSNNGGCCTSNRDTDALCVTSHSAWEKASKRILLSLQVKVDQTTSATNVLSTPGAIGNVTKRTGDHGQGLEPDEGQLSRPVRRGLVSGNTHRLPGGSPRALLRHEVASSTAGHSE